MRSLNYKATYQKLLTPEIVSYLAQIHECFLQDRNAERGVRTDSWTAGDGRSLESIILQFPVSVYTPGSLARLKTL